MNVEVENLPNCLASVRVEVPQAKVNEAFTKVAADFARAAKIPGYRPGKAPQKVIAARFKKEIRDEVEKSLISEGVRSAIADRKLRVLSVSGVEDVKLEEATGMRFTATL